jgi:hypothetical protein
VGLLEAYNYSWVLGWWSGMSQYYNLRGELTLWGWWGLALVYVGFAVAVACFGARHAAASSWLAG